VNTCDFGFVRKKIAREIRGDDKMSRYRGDREVDISTGVGGAMSKSIFAIFLTFVMILGSWGIVQAQQQPKDILRTLRFRSGNITLGDNLATIEQTVGFRFLDNSDTQTFLTKIWGNPPGAGRDALGLIIPTDADPLSDDGWAVVINYDPSGYVSDEEAGKISYDELMDKMKKDTAEASKKRIDQGYGNMELLGWARRPFYDVSQKKLYWAKRLRFDNSPEETLNYEIRILGRKGVLDLNIIASMGALPQIDKRVDAILSMIHFNKGNTYAEFNPNVDEAAAYGLAGLIAGGVLTKAGFFKGLLAVLFASKKLIGVLILGALGGLWAAIKLLFRRKTPPNATQ
jgi:uncharacterized membrane-anchored protein